VIAGLFNRGPLLDAARVTWLFDSYAWALGNFDASIFYADTQLVTPTNDHFPGRVDSVHGMASLIFDRVKGYAGVAHWPTELVDGSRCELPEAPRIAIEGPLRRSGEQLPAVTDGEERLIIAFDPNQVNNPEGLIAAYAHTIAHYLAAMGEESPPGGEAYWMQATELLAIYMGFGLMLANSVDNFRGGCGSCYNAAAQRAAFMAQDEATYALAIFAVLKGLPAKAVLPHLKKSLRGIFKRAMREVSENGEQLARLRAIR